MRDWWPLTWDIYICQRVFDRMIYLWNNTWKVFISSAMWCMSKNIWQIIHAWGNTWEVVKRDLRQNTPHWPMRLPPLSSRTSIIGFLCLQLSFLYHFWHHVMRNYLSYHFWHHVMPCIFFIVVSFHFQDEYSFEGWSVIRLLGGTWLDCGRCLVVGGGNSPLGRPRLRAVEKK